uniref:Uncharacterized protein LOC113797055 n=1 Tax=Dermatophagoides pteronyssinus TaxID=6956 RepID=A0A6P6YE35_DERPT
KALEAYKAEKFQKYYENEYVLAVYDNEVENLNKQWLTNASAQTNENGEAQPIKKQDSVKLSKKDLKKIEKKVISQIEAEPENSSFWDEFNEDRTKYYEKPTGVVAKSKKFFTRLWAEKKVNNEELMKKEELIRSQARRQFENIHTVDQSQSTEPGKLKSLVVAEDEDTDSLLAKTLNILNQEQVAVHEVIKTSDFPEPGKIDELEKWTKDFKDTRNKIRNEFNQKFELTLERPTSDDQTDKIEETKNKLVDTKLKQISEYSNKQLNDDSMNEKISKAAKDQATKIPQNDSFKKNKIQDTSAIIKADPIKSEIDSTNKQGDKIMKMLTGMLGGTPSGGFDNIIPQDNDQTSNYVKTVKAKYKTDKEEIYIESTLKNIYETSDTSEAKKKKLKSKPVETDEKKKVPVMELERFDPKYAGQDKTYLYSEQERKQFRQELNEVNRNKQEYMKEIAEVEKDIISGDAFKMEKRKMTDLEYANKILDELDKYEVK